MRSEIITKHRLQPGNERFSGEFNFRKLVLKARKALCRSGAELIGRQRERERGRWRGGMGRDIDKNTIQLIRYVTCLRVCVALNLVKQMCVL